MRLLKSTLVSLFTAAMFFVPVSGAQATGDCVVDNFTDAAGSDTNGDRTFRYCMTTDAQAGETITFDHQRSQQVIELEAVVSRSTSVTIDGEGYVTLTLADGSSDFRMIDISADIEVIGMTFRDGNASQGSAIHTTSSGDVTVRDSDFIDNEATVTGDEEINNIAEGGGAIDSDGDVFVYDSNFSGNISGRDGGAILAELNVTVEESTFSSNTAGDDGGAIYSRTGDITVTDSTFSGNKATESGGSSYTSRGGALYASSEDVLVSDSLFNGNEADNSGGAVHADDDFESIRSSFVSNSSGNGGAVLTEDDALLEDSYFGFNEVTSDGGAVHIEDELNISNSTFYQNQSAEQGGAIWSSLQGEETAGSYIIYSTFIDNTAENEASTLYFLGDDLDLFANLMISSQDKDQIAGDTGDFVDYGANVSSFEGEPVFDNQTSITGVDLATLRARDPRTATLSFQPTVRFRSLAKSEAEVTKELIDNYETETGRTLPTTDQLGQTRSASFFAGAEFLRWRSAYPVDYAGPIITDIGDNGVVAPFVVYGGETVRVVGERLSSISKVFVDGEEAELSDITDETFVMNFPDGVTEGTHDLVVQSSIGILTHTDGFLVRPTGTESVTSAGCLGVEPTVWTQRISDTQAKAYIKCPEAGKKYRILHQTGGSGAYESVLARTLESQDDTVQVFNEFGRYIVRTIDLVDINRLRITVDDSEVWKVRYNR